MISRDTFLWLSKSLLPEILLVASLLLYWFTRDIWTEYVFSGGEGAVQKALPFYLAMVGVAVHLGWRFARLVVRARRGRDFGDILNAVLYPVLFLFFFGIFLSLTSGIFS